MTQARPAAARHLVPGRAHLLACMLAVAATAAPPATAGERSSRLGVICPGRPEAAEIARWQPRQAALRRELRCRMTAVRAARGLPPLRRSRRLARAAARQARDMVRRPYFSHVAPGGRDLRTRVRTSGYLRRAKSWWVGEVLAWGTGRLAWPASTIARWLRSPPHRRVLLSPRARHIGIGIAPGRPLPGLSRGSATVAVLLGQRVRRPQRR